MILIYAILIISMYIFLKTPIRMVQKERLGIISLYPDVKEKIFEKNEWKGFLFSNNNFEFLIVSKKMKIEEYKGILNGEKRESKIYWDIQPFNDSGAYFLYKTKKGFKSVAVFYYKDKTYWAELYSSLSFDKYYNIMKDFLINMEIGNQMVNKDFVSELEKFKIPLSIVTSKESILLIISSIFLFTIFIVWIVFYIGFMKPKGVEGVFLEERTIVYTKTRFTNRSFPAYICVKDDKIMGFSAGKKIFEKELKDVELKDKKILFKIDGSEYIIPISHPERWRAFI